MTASLLRKHIPEYCWAWVIEFSLPTTARLGFLLLKVVTEHNPSPHAHARYGWCRRAAKTLKQTASTTDTPVLIISSLSENNGKKLIQEGAVGYFEKGSMTPEKLENAISGILKKRLLVPR
jgi:hypothetical protein